MLVDCLVLFPVKTIHRTLTNQPQYFTVTIFHFLWTYLVIILLLTQWRCFLLALFYYRLVLVCICNIIFAICIGCYAGIVL